MIAPDAVSAGERRCALALHALHAEDREWVLSQLDPASSSSVKSLLAELSQLGLPADPSISQQALASARDERVPHAPQALGKALENEPVTLLAFAVRELADASRDEVLANLGALRQRQVRMRLQEMDAGRPTAPLLEAALAAAVTTAVSVAAAAAGAVAAVEGAAQPTFPRPAHRAARWLSLWPRHKGART